MPTFKHPCPACGKLIARDVARCPFCGSVDPFVPGRCPKCQAPIEDAAWVACAKCGTPLKEGVAPMPGAPARRTAGPPTGHARRPRRPARPRPTGARRSAPPICGAPPAPQRRRGARLLRPAGRHPGSGCGGLHRLRHARAERWVCTVAADPLRSARPARPPPASREPRPSRPAVTRLGHAGRSDVAPRRNRTALALLRK